MNPVSFRARLLACPERSRRMPIKPIKSMGVSPCWTLLSHFPWNQPLSPQPVQPPRDCLFKNCPQSTFRVILVPSQIGYFSQPLWQERNGPRRSAYWAQVAVTVVGIRVVCPGFSSQTCGFYFGQFPVLRRGVRACIPLSRGLTRHLRNKTHLPSRGDTAKGDWLT